MALTAASAGAAGLGKLSVNSALGQPLSAEIELVSLQPGEFESIAARVASPESYRDAKIEYSPLLRQLRFAAERRSDGKPILKVTSSGPINEPFVDVLVEMNWPAGRLLREYPILLDPPGFSEARVTPPVATVTPVRPVASAPAAVSPPPSAPAPVAAPVATAPVASATPVAPIAPSGSPSAKSESGGDSYGPVKRGDTLSKIAQEMKSDTVSLEQMLVALYRENKSAFIDSNMNRLRTGQILKVPSAAEVAQIAEKEARAEIKVQVANWNAYREQVAGSAPSTPAKASPGNEATGKISVAKPDLPAAPAGGKDQLKIAKTDAAGGPAGASGAGGTAKLQEQIAALKEEKIASEKSLKEANSRVTDLEKQIADMRKLMELKGLSGKTDPKADPKAVAKPEPAKPADTKVAQVTPPPKAEPPKVEPAKAEPPKTEPAKVETKPEPAKPAEPPKTEETKPVVAKTPPKVAPPPPKPEPSFMEEYGLIAAGGTAGVLGIGGLLFAMSRKKKKASPGSTTSMGKNSSIMPSDLKPNTSTGNRGGGLVDTGNSSFLTDFDKTGPGSIDTDEVDPVAEAEVYIAYGRDAQAEEILKEAMSRDKSRHEITVKLLEIYHARKSVQAFETVARELKDNIGAENPMWAKVAAMGVSIDPENSLYGGSGHSYATTGAFAVGGAAVVASAAEKAPPDLDFDLGFGDSAAPSSTIDITAPNSGQPAAATDFDLDLGGNAPAAAAGGSDGGLDFDLALNAPASAAPAPAEAPAASGFDFDLSSLSLDSADATMPKPAAAADFTKTMAVNTPTHEKTTALNLGGLSLDLDAPAAGGGGDGPSAVATKLELAKAYVEIGDSDGAKDILNEVVREGSAAQQAEAKKILAGM